LCQVYKYAITEISAALVCMRRDVANTVMFQNLHELKVGYVTILQRGILRLCNSVSVLMLVGHMLL